MILKRKPNLSHRLMYASTDESFIVSNMKEPQQENTEIVMGCWDTMPKRSVILHPLPDVSERALRRIFATYSRAGVKDGGPDAFYTEFVSADGLASEKGRPKFLHNFRYSELEHPIIARIFSDDPESRE